MACPFFLPAERLSDGPGLHAPRLPLGAAYSGSCTCRPEISFQPDEATLRDVCNWGYVRGRCGHFPAGSAADAVRFSVVQESDAMLEILYVLELAHVPARHGTLRFSILDGVLDVDCGGLLAAQARSFIDSYLAPSQRPLETKLQKSVTA